jgi:hypothetical protein
MAWRVQRGPIPEGHGVYSQCRPAICVNGKHLLTGKNGSQQTLAGELGKAIKGEDASWAKLTEDRVRHIRDSVHSWDDVQDLASRYGVSTGCIYKVIKHQSWKHVV